jgi:hypothetical protein
MRAGLVTADRGVVTVFPPIWSAELVLAAAEYVDAVQQRFEELLARHARRYSGQQWRFSRRSPLRLVGAADRRLSAGQRIFLAVVRLSVLQRHAEPRVLGFDGVLEVLDEEHREAVRWVLGDLAAHRDNVALKQYIRLWQSGQAEGTP